MARGAYGHGFKNVERQRGLTDCIQQELVYSCNAYSCSAPASCSDLPALIADEIISFGTCGSLVARLPIKTAWLSFPVER